MSNLLEQSDYGRVAQAIEYLEGHYQQQPTLEDVAAQLHLSPFHLQRIFTRWAGVSPKRFVQYLTALHAKQLLANAHSVLDATYETGLSSPGRLHDLLIATEAVTPGEFKSKGEGVVISYGRHSSPFGDCLLAVTARGICALAFVDDNVEARSWRKTLAELQQNWAGASLVAAPASTQPFAEQIFGEVRTPTSELSLLLKGTNFQLKVWEALLKIPAGATWSYAEVAAAVGQPGAARAVGNAVGANPIGYLIPCHRVIRQNGLIEGYHWGATRKKAILTWEALQREGVLQAA